MSEIPNEPVKVKQRKGWTIHTLQDGDRFKSDCFSPTGEVLSTPHYETPLAAYNSGCSLVDRTIAATERRADYVLPKKLTLVLLYLMSWEEQAPDEIICRRSWKGYDFDILNELEAEGFIAEQKNRRTTKSVILTPEGIEAAQKLLEILPDLN
jgi:DNA-binding MarR family transcriptional regulator